MAELPHDQMVLESSLAIKGIQVLRTVKDQNSERKLQVVLCNGGHCVYGERVSDGPANSGKATICPVKEIDGPKNNTLKGHGLMSTDKENPVQKTR